MNHLKSATSPYLQQHADHPVHWWEWSPEAFAEARRRDVPVLVSIGYATCHWCHVMAHESFEDPETAALMNAGFVNIKVDREERPDVDSVYMDAVQALHGRGGWPLNAFVDHDGRPFFAAMYFPRERWREVVGHLSQAWRADRAQVDKAASELTAHLVSLGETRPAAATVGLLPLLARFDEELARRYDREHPGLGRAPKFPASQVIALELTRGCPDHAIAMLEAMQDAGVHDLVGGGFHRYATDRGWRVPHFEKMLYDQGQLLTGYALGAARSGRSDFFDTAEAIADYLARDLIVRDESGAMLGLASAEDADDPGGEGSFYAWSPEALTAALTGTPHEDLAPSLIEAWDLAPGHRERGPSGHLEPVTRHMPHPRAHDLEALAPTLGYGDARALRRAWREVFPTLRAVRARRPRPIRDDKVLTDMNALALSGLSTLARFRRRHAPFALALADRLLARIGPDRVERLPGATGYVTDYGLLACALLDAFHAFGEPRHLHAASRVIELAIARLAHPGGGFFSTPDDGERLIRRSREDTDGAHPSGQHSLALALARLGHLLEDEPLRARAAAVFEAQRGLVERAPTACPTLLLAMLEAEARPVTVVVTGDGERAAALAEAARELVRPGLFVLETRRFTPAEAAMIPALSPETGRLGRVEAEAHVCVGTECLLPITDPAALKAAIAGL